MKKRFLFWNDKDLYELKMRQIVLDSLKNENCKMWMVSTLDNFMSDYTVDKTIDALRSGQFEVDAVVRRDEHGKLWGCGEEWLKMIAACHELNIKTLYYDFGYFDHYKAFMFDTYDTNGDGSITVDWPEMSEEVNWETAPDHIKKYRKRFLKFLNRAKKEKPINNLKEGEYVVVWPQYSMDLVRPEFAQGLEKRTEVTDWVNKICEMVRDSGLTPVVKGGPAMHAWSRLDAASVKNAAVFVHDEHQLGEIPSAKYEKNINYRLIAHAKYHVVSCSSVTNELVLADAPIIATGQSWFTGLDIFNEPKNWDSLLDNPMYINTPNRNKWINWWFSRQVPRDNAVEKVMEIYDKYPIMRK